MFMFISCLICKKKLLFFSEVMCWTLSWPGPALSQFLSFAFGKCFYFAGHKSREVTCEIPATNPCNSTFPSFDGDLLFVVQTATLAFDGVDEMCAVCYQCGTGTIRAWIEDQFRLALAPFLIHSQSSMLCGCLLSLKYRCDLQTKAAVCTVISSPKLIFLIAVHCFYFPEHELFLQIAPPQALFKTINSIKKCHKRLWHLATP